MSLPNARTNNEKAFPKTPGGTILIPWTIGDSDCQIAVCAEVEMLADDLVVQSGEALREALQAEWDRADLSPLIKLQAE